MTTARALLLGLTLLLLPSITSASKNDAAASSLIEQAKHLSDIRADGAPPFQLRMTFRVAKKDGTVTEGVYTEVWISKAQWRRETNIGTFRRTEVAIGRKKWLLDSSTVIPDHIGEIPHLSEFGSLSGKWRSAKDREFNGVNLRCVEQKNDLGSWALCFAKVDRAVAAEPRPWALSSHIGDRACSYSDYQKYGDRIFPTSYECGEGKQLILQARIGELSALSSQESQLFTPPNGAKESLNCLDPIQPPRALSSTELPPPTQSFSGTIIVSVSTTVGTDGRTHNLTVISEPKKAFDDTALESVRQWRFDPGRCGSEPMETEVVVQVAYTHY